MEAGAIDDWCNVLVAMVEDLVQRQIIGQRDF